jgi:hypothetical protein
MALEPVGEWLEWARDGTPQWSPFTGTICKDEKERYVTVQCIPEIKMDVNLIYRQRYVFRFYGSYELLYMDWEQHTIRISDDPSLDPFEKKLKNLIPVGYIRRDGDTISAMQLDLNIHNGPRACQDSKHGSLTMQKRATTEWPILETLGFIFLCCTSCAKRNGYRGVCALCFQPQSILRDTGFVEKELFAKETLHPLSPILLCPKCSSSSSSKKRPTFQWGGFGRGGSSS